MDQLHCMRVFVRVVEQGSFTRAADDLGMSRASVTTAVGQLEAHLGIRLLNRTTRRLSLTEEGRSYYRDCVLILDQVAEAEDSLSSSRRTARGRLRISIAQSFEALGFFPLLAEFMEQNPELILEVIVTDRAVNLVEEGIDCAVRATDIPADAALVARKVMSARWLTCATPGYLAAHGTPRTIDDLARHNCIRFISPSTCRVREWYFDDSGAIVTHVPNGNLWLTSLDAAVSAALSGIGVAQVPDLLAFPALLDGRLRPVLTQYVARAMPVMLVYPANRYLPAKVRAFAEFLDHAYPKDGCWPQVAARLADATSELPATRPRRPRVVN